MTRLGDEYDYIVIGAGSAGCVTASRLVADRKAQVLVLESGWPDRNPLIRIPAGFVRIMTKHSRFMTRYQSEPQSQLGGRRLDLAQANVVGGGSSINAMAYTRGTRQDYDRWDALMGGRSGWSWDELLPFFVGLESNQRLGAPFHGTQGPLRVSDAHHPATDISRAFLLAAQARGIAYSSDLNSGDERGISLMQSTTYRGERWSAARAFLDPLHADSKLTVRDDALASRVILSNGRALGVEYTDRNGRNPRKAFARAGVILTAGALSSPKLLMLSGIGPADHLKTLGLPVHVDLPGVGQNLSDHTKVPLAIRTTKNFGYSGEDSGLRMLWHGLQYLLTRSGAASSTGSEVTGFFDPDDPGAEPILQVYCLGTLFGEPGKRLLPGATLSVDLVAPHSTGSLRLRSADPAAPPSVDPGLLRMEYDVEKLLSGLKFLLEIVRTKPLAEMVAEILAPVAGIRSNAELIGYMRSVAHSNWHFAGTCRMGPDNDAMAVLDGQLRVRGVDRLWIFDASMMPKVVRANTNACVMAVADRACALLAD